LFANDGEDLLKVALSGCAKAAGAKYGANITIKTIRYQLLIETPFL
jgi:hypothetical protein